MKLAVSSRTRNRLALAAICLTPIVMFWWMLPFVGKTTLGRDYVCYPLWEQMELQFCAKHGSFPLFVPGFAGGQTSAALTLGQFFHPISHICAHMPGYWTGHPHDWNTLFRLISLGAAQWFLFLTFRRLRLGIALAYALSCATVYNLRMLDLFRYGASLESWTGCLLLCAAAARMWHHPGSMRSRVFVVASAYWLICSGHPQMAFFGAVGSAAFAALYPFLADCMLRARPTARTVVARYYGELSLLVLAAGLLSSAYVLPFLLDFYRETAERTSSGYAWAAGYGDTLAGSFANFVLPLRSDVHGAFGGTLLPLVAFLVPLAALPRRRLPGVVWAAWILLILTFMISLGSHTAFHWLAWEFFPFFSSVRGPGRITIVVPLLSAMVTAWLLGGRGRGPASQANVSVRVVAITAIGCQIVALAGLGALHHSYSMFSAVVIRAIPVGTELAGWLVALLGLLPFCVPVGQESAKRILALMTIAELALVLPNGTWLNGAPNVPTYAGLEAMKHMGLDNTLLAGDGLFPRIVSSHLKRGAPEPILAAVYRSCVQVPDDSAAYARLTCHRLPGQIVLVGSAPNTASAASEGLAAYPARITLCYSSYNGLAMATWSPCSAYVCISYPHSQLWSASVNRQATPILRANGMSMGIRLPPGSSIVRLDYWSPTMNAGIIISLSTLALLLVLLTCASRHKPPWLAASLVATSACGLLYLLWLTSIRNGGDLGSRYTWVEPVHLDTCDLAFGKRAWLSSPLDDGLEYICGAGRAVDGALGQTAITGMAESPSLTVDLCTPHRIGEVAVFEHGQLPGLNGRPLTIESSLDGSIWDTLGQLAQSDDRRPGMVWPTTPTLRRFVRVRASGMSVLAIDELVVHATPCTPCEWGRSLMCETANCSGWPRPGAIVQTLLGSTARQ